MGRRSSYIALPATSKATLSMPRQHPNYQTPGTQAAEHKGGELGV